MNQSRDFREVSCPLDLRATEIQALPVAVSECSSWHCHPGERFQMKCQAHFTQFIVPRGELRVIDALLQSSVNFLRAAVILPHLLL